MDSLHSFVFTVSEFCTPGCPKRFVFRLSTPMISREVPAEYSEHLHLVNLPAARATRSKFTAWISFPVPDPYPSNMLHVSTSSGAFLASSPLPCPSIPESIPYLIRFEKSLQPFCHHFLGNDTIRKRKALQERNNPLKQRFQSPLDQFRANDFYDRRYVAFDLFPLRPFGHYANQCLRA
jgi:hypothetical protein